MAVSYAEQRVRERFQKKYYVDYGLIFTVVFLLAFGLIMLLSTSSYEANLKFGNSFHYFSKQAGTAVLGFVAMLGLTFFPRYRLYEKLSFPAYITGLCAPLLVLTPLAYRANGATRWIRIFGISVQPAEITKFMMIIFLASFISRLGKQVSTRRGFWMTLGLAAMPAALIKLVTNNLSSAIIVMGIAVVMLFISCPDYRRFILMGLLAILVVAGVIMYARSIPDNSDMGFRLRRVLTWLSPEKYASGTGMQTIQALYAIGSGGLFGKGLGASMQKLGFIPEAQNDMIFSIICEELGLFGAIAVILMFILLIWRMRVIANSAQDMFGALLVVGVMSHIAIQVILNIAVVTNTIPNTGITLPFISYGGSAVLVQLAEMGIVSNVARLSSVIYE